MNKYIVRVHMKTFLDVIVEANEPEIAEDIAQGMSVDDLLNIQEGGYEDTIDIAGHAIVDNAIVIREVEEK